VRKSADGGLTGVCLRAVDVSTRDVQVLAHKAERLGFDSFWVTEEMSRSSPPLLALAALATEKIKIGTAIISIYSRTPMTIAMTAATLTELAGPRFILGLGSGGIEITKRGHGVPPEKPVKRMEEYVKIIRDFLGGQKVNHQGEFFHVSDVRLWITPSHIPPLYLAALNPKMIELAGAVADGIILNVFDPKASSYVDELLRKGLAKSGRHVSSVKKCSFVLAAADSSRDSVETLKKSIVFYISAPSYRRIVREAGYGDVVDEVVDTLTKHGREKAVARVPDELVEGVALTCDQNIVESLERYVKAGVEPLIYPQPKKNNELKDIVKIMEAVSNTFNLY